MNRIHENEIEQRDVAAEQYHRNDHDEGRISQLLVLADPFFIWVPRPGSFLKLDLNFVDKVFRFRNHRITQEGRKPSSVCRETSSFIIHPSSFQNHARRDSNPQQAVLETATLPIELLA